MCVGAYPVRAPTTCARAEYRLGAVSVLRKRRGVAVIDLRVEMRRDWRSIGVNVREAMLMEAEMVGTVDVL